MASEPQWVRRPHLGGFETVDGRWLLARTSIHSTWVLTDRRTGYRRHFATAPQGMTFVREQWSSSAETGGTTWWD